jgi:hypothetical protein
VLGQLGEAEVAALAVKPIDADRNRRRLRQRPLETAKR